jgi:hypothetical protein
MSEQRSAGGKPRILLWLAIFGVLAVLLLVVALGAWQTRQQGELVRQRAEISEAGAPFSAIDLEAFYAAPPEGQDTTKLWLDGIAPLALPAFANAAQALPIVGADGPTEIPPPGRAWAELPAAEKLLARYQSSLILLHQAAEQGGQARFPTAFQKGWAMLLTHCQNLRTASRLLVLEAHVRAHRGDAHGAVQSIEAALAVGHSLKNEPLTISQLVRMACDDNARSHFRDLLPQVAFSEEDLLRLQAKLEGIEYRSGLQRALIGERVLGSMALGDPGQLTATGGAPQAVEYLLPLFGAGAQRVYLQTMDESIRAADLPWPQAIGEAKRIESQLATQQEAAFAINRLKYILSGLVTTSSESIFVATARQTADNDGTLATIAIELYRKQHGVFPEHLGQLVPERLKFVPLDPFNGRPLRYVPAENGYIVYNVGQDGIDNGGVGDETRRPDDVIRMEYLKATDKH